MADDLHPPRAARPSSPAPSWSSRRCTPRRRPTRRSREDAGHADAGRGRRRAAHGRPGASGCSGPATRRSCRPATRHRVASRDGERALVIVGFRPLRARRPERVPAEAQPLERPAEVAPAQQQVVARARAWPAAPGRSAPRRAAAPPRAAGSRGGCAYSGYGPAAVALGGAGGHQQVGVALEQVQVAVAERAQALGGGAPGPSGGGPEISGSWNSRVCSSSSASASPARSPKRRYSVPVPTPAGARDVLHRDVLDAARSLDEPRRRLAGSAGGCGRRRRARAAASSSKTGRSGTVTIMPPARPARAPRGTDRRADRPGGRSARGRRARRRRANAPSAMPTGSSDSSTCAPLALSTLRTSACAQTAPNRPVLAPMTAAGLASQDVVRERARGPVERVLEAARDARRCTRAWRSGARRPPRSRRRRSCTRRGRVGLEVLVEDGQAAEAVPLHELDPGRQRRSPPPGAACGCGSPGARCPRCRGSASRPTPARRARARRSA